MNGVVVIHRTFADIGNTGVCTYAISVRSVAKGHLDSHSEGDMRPIGQIVRHETWKHVRCVAEAPTYDEDGNQRAIGCLRCT